MVLSSGWPTFSNFILPLDIAVQSGSKMLVVTDPLLIYGSYLSLWIVGDSGGS